jgi:chromosomal replication initiation ATPase DnaA
MGEAKRRKLAGTYPPYHDGWSHVTAEVFRVMRPDVRRVANLFLGERLDTHPDQEPISIRGFLSMVAMDTKISMRKMLSASDDPSIVAARDVVMWLSRAEMHDIAAIATALGRDTGEVVDALSRVEDRIRVDPSFVDYLRSYALIIGRGA